MCDTMLSKMVKTAREAGMSRGKTVWVAIDKTLRPRHDKDNMDIRVAIDPTIMVS